MCQERKWNQRYKDNIQRIRSGDRQEQVAVVIRSLRRRDGEESVHRERKMLQRQKILVSELALGAGAGIMGRSSISWKTLV